MTNTIVKQIRERAHLVATEAAHKTLDDDDFNDADRAIFIKLTARMVENIIIDRFMGDMAILEDMEELGANDG